MEGTIFIRGNQITELEEEILTKFKEEGVSRRNGKYSTLRIESIK